MSSSLVSSSSVPTPRLLVLSLALALLSSIGSAPVTQAAPGRSTLSVAVDDDSVAVSLSPEFGCGTAACENALRTMNLVAGSEVRGYRISSAGGDSLSGRLIQPGLTLSFNAAAAALSSAYVGQAGDLLLIEEPGLSIQADRDGVIFDISGPGMDLVTSDRLSIEVSGYSFGFSLDRHGLDIDMRRLGGGVICACDPTAGIWAFCPDPPGCTAACCGFTGGGPGGN